MKKIIGKNKQAIICDKNEVNGDLESINSLLIRGDYVTLKNNIPKYKNITYSDVNDIINSNPREMFIHDYMNFDNTRYNLYLIEDILDEIIKTGYKMTKENFMKLGENLNMYNRPYKFESNNLISNFSIGDDEIEEFADFFAKKSILLTIMMESNLHLIDENTIDNMICVLCLIGSLYLLHIAVENEIPITKKHLDYAKKISIRKFILKNMTEVIPKVKKMEKCEKDNELLKCDTIEKVEDFMNKNNYQITSQIIIMACQNNIHSDVLYHLLSYKINFDENSVNEIIKSYRDNTNIEKLLLLICQYGYEFKKSNYIEMLYSKNFCSLFQGKLLDNFVLDDEIISVICGMYNNSVCSHFYLENFLENIEILGYKNKIAATGIMAIYCLLGDVDKIKKLRKEYDVKLTPICLKYLYKNKYGIKKNIMDLFKKDGVKPDFDVLKQYIETFSTRREQMYLFDLLKD